MPQMPTPKESLEILNQGCAQAQMSRADHVKCQLAIQVLGDQLQILEAMQTGGTSDETPDKMLTEGSDDGPKPS